MVRESLTIDEAVELLNSALEADPVAVSALVVHRVPCNDALVNHPTVQTGPNGVGLLGIINGLFGTNEAGSGVIAAEATSRFGPVTKFVRLP